VSTAQPDSSFFSSLVESALSCTSPTSLSDRRAALALAHRTPSLLNTTSFTTTVLTRLHTALDLHDDLGVDLALSLLTGLDRGALSAIDFTLEGRFLLMIRCVSRSRRCPQRALFGLLVRAAMQTANPVGALLTAASTMERCSYVAGPHVEDALAMATELLQRKDPATGRYVFPDEVLLEPTVDGRSGLALLVHRRWPLEIPRIDRLVRFLWTGLGAPKSAHVDQPMYGSVGSTYTTVLASAPRRLLRVRLWPRTKFYADAASYILFLVVLSLVVLGVSGLSTKNNRFVSNAEALAGKGEFSELRSVAGFYDWARGVLVPRVSALSAAPTLCLLLEGCAAAPACAPGGACSQALLAEQARTLALITDVTLRSVRVKPERCDGDVGTLLPASAAPCWSSFSQGIVAKTFVEDAVPGPALALVAEDAAAAHNVSAADVLAALTEARQYRRHSEAGQEQTRAKVSSFSYPAGGFTVTLPVRSSPDLALATLDALQASRWVVPATRAVIVDLSLASTNSAMVVSLRFVLEVLKDGPAVPTVLPVVLDSSDLDRLSGARVLMEVVIGLYVFSFCVENVVSLRRAWLGTKTHSLVKSNLYRRAIVFPVLRRFATPWNILSLLTTVCLLSAYITRTALVWPAVERLKQASRRQDPPVVITSLAFTAGSHGYRESMWLAAGTLFAYLTLFRFLILTESFGPLLVVAIKSVQLTLGFLVVLGITIIAFVFYFTVAFGPFLPEFASLSSSFTSLWRLMLGDISLSSLATETGFRFFSAVGILSACVFIITTTLLLLNLLIAIITNLFDKTMDSKNEPRRLLAWSVLLYQEMEAIPPFTPYVIAFKLLRWALKGSNSTPQETQKEQRFTFDFREGAKLKLPSERRAEEQLASEMVNERVEARLHELLLQSRLGRGVAAGWGAASGGAGRGACAGGACGARHRKGDDAPAVPGRGVEKVWGDGWG
jgi:hypothetical protein